MTENACWRCFLTCDEIFRLKHDENCSVNLCPHSGAPTHLMLQQHNWEDKVRSVSDFLDNCL